MRTQQLELQGRIPFNKGEYHNQEFEEMMAWTGAQRDQRLHVLLEEKTRRDVWLKQQAREYLERFRIYVEHQYKAMPEELQVTSRAVSHLREVYQVFRERKSSKLEGQHLTSFLDEYVKMFGFEFSIEPEILMRQIHPFHGQLGRLERFLGFEELVDLFKIFVVASFERLQGQSLLASQVCAFGYWSHFDTKSQGVIEPEDFFRLLRVFRVSVNDLGDLEKETKYLKVERPDLLLDSGAGISECVLSLDLFQSISLERDF